MLALELKSTNNMEDALSQWLVVHDLLLAAGFRGGVFDTDSEVKAFITPRSGDWDSPTSADERKRTEGAYKAFKSLNPRSEGMSSFSVSSLQAAIQAAVHTCAGLKLEVTQVVQVSGVETTRTSEKRWRVFRHGELWAYLERRDVQEWVAFFSRHRRDQRGV